MVQSFHQKLQYYIRWPTIQEWQAMEGIWKNIPFAVGAIDGTSHRIYRPEKRTTGNVFLGHRDYH